MDTLFIICLCSRFLSFCSSCPVLSLRFVIYFFSIPRKAFRFLAIDLNRDESFQTGSKTSQMIIFATQKIHMPFWTIVLYFPRLFRILTTVRRSRFIADQKRATSVRFSRSFSENSCIGFPRIFLPLRFWKIRGLLHRTLMAQRCSINRCIYKFYELIDRVKLKRRYEPHRNSNATEARYTFKLISLPMESTRSQCAATYSHTRKIYVSLLFM